MMLNKVDTFPKRPAYQSDFTVGFTCGTFDLFHAGHVIMMEECKKHCSFLMVGIQVDPSKDRSFKNRPVQSIVERQIQVGACRYVDDIIVYETESDLEDLLKTLDIDKRFVGAEYYNQEFTGRKICLDRNIEIVYNMRDHSFSSSSLRERVVKANDRV